MKNDFPLYNNNKTSLQGQDFKISQFLYIYINQIKDGLCSKILDFKSIDNIDKHSLGHLLSKSVIVFMA